jgi:hypothetical protein
MGTLVAVEGGGGGILWWADRLSACQEELYCAQMLMGHGVVSAVGGTSFFRRGGALITATAKADDAKVGL